MCSTLKGRLELRSTKLHRKGRGTRGYKVEITGAGIYGSLKFESGVHRVQKFQKLDLRDVCIHQQLQWPLASKQKRKDFELNMSDVKGTFRASGQEDST